MKVWQAKRIEMLTECTVEESHVGADSCSMDFPAQQWLNVMIFKILKDHCLCPFTK
jgi:hypothetical protein